MRQNGVVSTPICQFHLISSLNFSPLPYYIRRDTQSARGADFTAYHAAPTTPRYHAKRSLKRGQEGGKIKRRPKDNLRRYEIVAKTGGAL
jgi:hypothetical protein